MNLESSNAADSVSLDFILVLRLVRLSVLLDTTVGNNPIAMVFFGK
jgi:hypothetical protein